MTQAEQTKSQVAVSVPPHVRGRRTTRGIMLDVVIALVPSAVAALVFFQLYALMLLLVCVASAVAAEFVCYFISKGGFAHKCSRAGEVVKNWARQFDCTSVVTGLILALILPAYTEWYEALLGAVFAIVLVKMLFGGTGKNLVNPAAAGRVFLFISFSLSAGALLTDGVLETGSTYLSGTLLAGGSLSGSASYAEPVPTLLQLFLGNGVATAAIGETCKLAILVGYLYLVIRKVIKWWQPLLLIALSGFVSVCLAATGGTFDITLFPDYCLSGGLVFGAVFMATDYVTSPKGVWGQLVYYIALAVLTAVLRYFTHIEVMSFIILLMNLLTPLIDTYIVRKPFGYKRERKAKEAVK